MKRTVCSLLIAMAIAACLSAAADGAVNRWTTKENPYYHADPACGGMTGAVLISAEAASAFGKLPCPVCLAAAGEALPADYNDFEDTSHWRGCFIPLRRQEEGREEMSSPVLAGAWIYYLKETFVPDETSFDGERSETSLCRCRAEDLSGEETLLDAPQPFGGMRDIGDGLLLWYSDIQYSGSGKGGTIVHFMKLDYGGGEPVELAACHIPRMDYISDLTVAGRTVWFSWYDFEMDISREGATGKLTYAIGEIYELRLDDPEPVPRLVFTEDRMVYDTVYAYGKLYFFDHDDDGLYYCALDPAVGKREVLLRVDGSPGSAYDGRFMVMNRRFYCWDDDRQRTVSMALDGSDVREVSKDRFGFRQAWNGHVLAAKQIKSKTLEDKWYTSDSTYVYHPKDAENPSFDPDRCPKTHIDDEDFMLGDYFYEHRDGGIARVLDKADGD